MFKFLGFMVAKIIMLPAPLFAFVASVATWDWDIFIDTLDAWDNIDLDK